MAINVKICGLKTASTLTTALDAGADYVGLVFFPPSPRNVDIEDARTLVAMARGRARVVALTVDPDDALIDAIATSVAMGDRKQAISSIKLNERLLVNLRY